MTCPLTDSELNGWCAGVLGIDPMNLGKSGRRLLEGEPEWAPCADRNQAQLVIERAIEVAKDDAEWSEFNALKFSPRQICEAAWEAMQ